MRGPARQAGPTIWPSTLVFPQLPKGLRSGTQTVPPDRPLRSRNGRSASVTFQALSVTAAGPRRRVAAGFAGARRAVVTVVAFRAACYDGLWLGIQGCLHQTHLVRQLPSVRFSQLCTIAVIVRGFAAERPGQRWRGRHAGFLCSACDALVRLSHRFCACEYPPDRGPYQWRKLPNEDLFEGTHDDLRRAPRRAARGAVPSLVGLVLGFVIGLCVAKYVVRWINTPLEEALDEHYELLAERATDRIYGERGPRGTAQDFMKEERLLFDEVYLEQSELQRIAGDSANDFADHLRRL